MEARTMRPSTVAWLFCSLLSTLVRGQDSDSCEASCTVPLQYNPGVSWASVQAQQTVTDQIILIVDEAAGTTETITSTADHDQSLSRVSLLPTNADGTVYQMVTGDDGKATSLVYPTVTVFYLTDYAMYGVLPTQSAGEEVCVSAALTDETFFTYSSDAMELLTQPTLTFPDGGDQYGLYYTTTGGEWGWNDEFMATVSAEEAAFRSCSVNVIAPASAVEEVLVLTSTSVSTKSPAAAATTDSPAAAAKTDSPAAAASSDSPVVVATADTPAPKVTTTIEATPPTTTAPPPPPQTQTITVGGGIVSVSYIAATTAAANAQTTGPRNTTPAIVIGTQTIVLGHTTTVNGVTVVATKDTNDNAAILVAGPHGTSTIAVSKPTSSGQAVGNAIASGIGLIGPTGTKTTLPGIQSSNGASKSGLEIQGVLFGLFVGALVA